MSRSAPALVVIVGAFFDADRLGHGDLHVVDEVAIPQGLDQGVGEAENQQVLHRLLAEKVIDTVDLLLAKMLVQQLVQHPRRFDVFAKRFFDHHAIQPARLVEPDRLEVMDDRAEFGRLDRQIEHRARAGRLGRQSVGQRLIRSDIVEVALLIAEARDKALEYRRIKTALDLAGQHFAHVLAPFLVAPGTTCKRHDTERFCQPRGRFQVIQRRQQLVAGEVAGGAKNHERARQHCRRDLRLHLPSSLTACPPNPWRILASILAA